MSCTRGRELGQSAAAYSRVKEGNIVLALAAAKKQKLMQLKAWVVCLGEGMRHGAWADVEEKADTSKWEDQNRFSLFGRALGFINGGKVRLVGFGNMALWKSDAKIGSRF